MKNKINISILLFFSTLFLSKDILLAKAIVCNTANTICLEYTRVSHDGGNTWVTACCDNLVIVVGENTCTDDCYTRGNERTSRSPVNSIGLSGIEINVNENGINQTYIIEFKGNSILVNGEVMNKFNEEITDIHFSLSGSEAVYWLKSYAATTKDVSALATSVFKDLTTEDMQAKLRNRKAKEESISFYPNPVIDGIINIHSSQPLKEVLIYNVSGDILLRQEGDTNIIRTNNKLTPGVYFIKSYFENSINHSIKKIIIL